MLSDYLVGLLDLDGSTSFSVRFSMITVGMFVAVKLSGYVLCKKKSNTSSGEN